MPAINVARSILIDSPLQKVRESLIDYRQWPEWSPWLIMEADTKVNYNDKQGKPGAIYDWEGELTGQGVMELTSIADKQLDMHLQFIKPFKSIAEIRFDLEEQGDATKVTWNMKSRLPFFIYWLAGKFEAFIGMDYERGLKMLKDYLETGLVFSQIKIEGIKPIKSQLYVGIQNECDLKDMANVMPDDFQKIYQFLDEKNLIQEGVVPFAIYNRFDPVRKHSSFISAIPVDSEIEAKAPFVNGELKASDGMVVRHIGKYEHLGNAWATAMNYSRHKKIKTTKLPMGIEFYFNDPMVTAPEDLITEVVLPIKKL